MKLAQGSYGVKWHLASEYNSCPYRKLTTGLLGRNLRIDLQARSETTIELYICTIYALEPAGQFEARAKVT